MNGLYFFLDIVRDLFKARISAGAAEGKYHDRHFRKVHLKDRGVVFEIGREFVLCLIYLVPDLFEGIVNISARYKLYAY